MSCIFASFYFKNKIQILVYILTEVLRSIDFLKFHIAGFLSIFCLFLFLALRSICIFLYSSFLRIWHRKLSYFTKKVGIFNDTKRTKKLIPFHLLFLTKQFHLDIEENVFFCWILQFYFHFVHLLVSPLFHPSRSLESLLRRALAGLGVRDTVDRWDGGELFLLRIASCLCCQMTFFKYCYYPSPLTILSLTFYYPLY